MLHLAKAADPGPNTQFITMWNRLHVSLRRGIPEPTKPTSFGQLLDQIDGKSAIWYELAHRPTFQQQQSNQRSAMRSFKPRNLLPQQQNVNTRTYLTELGGSCRESPGYATLYG